MFFGNENKANDNTKNLMYTKISINPFSPSQFISLYLYIIHTKYVLW